MFEFYEGMQLLQIYQHYYVIPSTNPPLLLLWIKLHICLEHPNFSKCQLSLYISVELYNKYIDGQTFLFLYDTAKFFLFIYIISGNSTIPTLFCRHGTSDRYNVTFDDTNVTYDNNNNLTYNDIYHYITWYSKFLFIY